MFIQCFQAERPKKNIQMAAHESPKVAHNFFELDTPDLEHQ